MTAIRDDQFQPGGAVVIDNPQDEVEAIIIDNPQDEVEAVIMGHPQDQVEAGVIDESDDEMTRVQFVDQPGGGPEPTSAIAPPLIPPEKSPLRWAFQLAARFRNLSIGAKQLSVLFTAELFTIVGLVVVGALLIQSGGESQLQQQAKSELAVTRFKFKSQVPEPGTLAQAPLDSSATGTPLSWVVSETLEALSGGYSAVYLRSTNGSFGLAASLEQSQNVPQPGLALQDSSLIEAAIANPTAVVTGRQRVGGHNYTLAASTVMTNGQPTAVLVRGTSETAMRQLNERSLMLQLVVAIAALGLTIPLALLLRSIIVQPIRQLQDTTQRFSDGDLTARAKGFAQDEVGQLATTFNSMANNICAAAESLADQAQTRQAEAEKQRQQKERIQEGFINLLLEIEGAQRGDLTTRATVDNSEMGSVADAFNATIQHLSEIVTQVKVSSSQVQEAAINSQTSVQKLTQDSTTQARVTATALNSVEDMSRSIQSVAASTQEAVAIARVALAAAEEGSQTMDLTVGSIENIRTSVSETSKKVKRLAASSQEISKIIHIISAISEKTNLLAFNASIEASRAGENGQGFRVVADEVRRLAERATNSTKEVEQLVTSIQEDTAAVLHTMEGSTNEVVTGTQLVDKTKETLQGLAQISQQIDELLQSISTSTVSQAETSRLVNETMQDVEAIAQTTSAESQVVSAVMHNLVVVAEQLQQSVARFQVE